MAFILDADSAQASQNTLLTEACSLDIPAQMIPTCSSKWEQENAISTLKSYAFIAEQTPQGLQEDQSLSPVEMYNVHPLVHLSIRKWIQAHGKWSYWNEQAVARLLHLMPHGSVFSKEIWAPYVSHATHIVQAQDNRHIKGRIWLLEVLGEREWTLHHISSSNHWLRLAAEQGEELLGDEYSDATSVSTQAKVMIFQSATTKAIGVLQEAIAAENTAHGGVATPPLLICIIYLGAAWNSLGKFRSAERILRGQLAREDKGHGTLPPQILVLAMAHL